MNRASTALLCSMACVIFGALLRSQSVPVWFAHSSYAQPPALSQGPTGTGETRDLTPEEMEAVDRMLEATAHYVSTHPELAPQLEAMREGKKHLRRKDDLRPPRGWGWWTLPDLARVGGPGARWLPPGAKEPPRPDGQILRPNTTLINEGEIPIADPANGCLARANGIQAIIHEGYRHLQVGVQNAEGVSDCRLDVWGVKNYANDVRMYQDFLDNGVPLGPGPGAPKCTMSDEEKRLMRAYQKQAKSAKDQLCKRLQDMNCNPMPPECS
jgi:hypothetical protein